MYFCFPKLNAEICWKEGYALLIDLTALVGIVAASPYRHNTALYEQFPQSLASRSSFLIGIFNNSHSINVTLMISFYLQLILTIILIFGKVLIVSLVQLL